MNKLTFNKAKWLIIVILLPFVICNASPNQANLDSQYESNAMQCDSMISTWQPLGCKSTICINTPTDSIMAIIENFKKVECELLARNSQDTTRSDTFKTLKMLPHKWNEVLRYLLLDEDNYKSNDIVYGLFSSSISYKLCQSRKKYIYAEFDFGLRKWQILDSKKEIIFQGDIKENNLQVLRFSRLVFPEDETLKIVQNNLKTF